MEYCWDKLSESQRESCRAHLMKGRQ